MHWYVPSAHKGAVLTPAASIIITKSGLGEGESLIPPEQHESEEAALAASASNPQEYKYWNTKSDDPSMDWQLPVTW